MATRWMLAVLLMVVPLTAFAEKPAKYLGITVGEHQVEVDNGWDDVTNVGLRLGYSFSDFIGVELQAGGGNEGNPDSLEGPQLTYAGGYLRLNLPYEDANVFLLAGAATVDYDQVDASVSEDGVSAGIGIELYGTERTALTFSYMDYASGTYNGFSLGFVHHFNFPEFRDP